VFYSQDPTNVMNYHKNNNKIILALSKQKTVWSFSGRIQSEILLTVNGDRGWTLKNMDFIPLPLHKTSDGQC